MALMGINDPRQLQLARNPNMTPEQIAADNQAVFNNMPPQVQQAFKGLMAQQGVNKPPMPMQQGNAPVMATGSPMVGMANPQQPQVTGGTQYLFPTAPQAATQGTFPTMGSIGMPNAGSTSAGGLSTGQILGGLGAIGLGGLFGGTSGAAGVLGDLGTLYNWYTQGQAQEDVAKNLAQGFGTLGDVLSQQVQFKPFTVTSSTGAVQTTPEGGYSIGLTPEQQAIQNQLFQTASGLFGQVGQSTAQRESDVYNQIRALQTPQEEQARLALEERLAAQGRLGLSSAAYGGSTPELMAQEQAISQARQQAALAAISQAQAEQAQAAEIGRGLFTSGYLPQANILNMLQPAVNLANIVGTGQRQGAGILSEMAIAQMQAQAQAALANAAQKGDITSAITGLLTGQQKGGGPSIIEQIFGSLFSGNSEPDWVQEAYNTYQEPPYVPSTDQGMYA